MLLSGNDCARIGNSLCDDVAVDGLDGVDVHHARLDALGSEQLTCLKRHGNHQTGCDDGHVGAVCQLNATSELELVVGAIVDHGNCKSAEAEVEGAVGGESRLNGSLCLNGVGGVDHGHAGDGAHEREVLVALVGCAVLTHRDACVGCADLDVEVGVANRVTHLLKCSACGEHCKARCENGLARGCDTCCNADHVALGDAAIEKSFGMCLFELYGFGCLCEVGVQNHEIIFVGELNERVAVAFTGCDLICHCCVPPYAFSSATAAAYCSSLGAEPCQLTLFSMNETPLPFTVFAIIAVGLPFTVRASLKAASICSKS